MVNTPIALGAFLIFILFLLALDLGLFHRRERQIRMREALMMSFGYFLLAMVFASGLYRYSGHEKAIEFVTGYLVELSLSVDNLFVFVLIFTHFMVPQQYQHRVLFWGILGALIMRAVFIFGGTALVHQFEWLMYVFGAILIFTSIKMLFAADEEPDLENNRVVRLLNRYGRVTKEYDGKNFTTRKNGKIWLTPLCVVLVLVEVSDVIFAMDSIPAIFAITRDPLIIYTSNVFAILGLRSLYFALAAVIHRFQYLKYGLSLVLLLIGSKMIINEFYGYKVIPTELALSATGILLVGSIIISLLKTRKHVSKAEAMTGWVPGSESKEEKKKKD